MDIGRVGDIFGGLGNKLLSSKIMENLVPDLEQYNQRRHLENLMWGDNQDWRTQASLGDIEFEQDMYDDIMYGDPYMSEGTASPRTQELYENVFGVAPPYDELAMMGLRKHAMEGGPLRYMDETPYDVGEFRDEVWEPDESGYLGVYHEAPGWEPRIDINLPLIEEDYRRFNTDEYGRYRGSPEGLGKNISDTYRHEYKHGVLDNTNPYSHPAIYGTNAMYGLGEGDVRTSDWRFKMGPVSYGEAEKIGMTGPDRFGRPRQYNPDKVGDLLRDVTGRNRSTGIAPPSQRPRGTERFNTGGLASLML